MKAYKHILYFALLGAVVTGCGNDEFDNPDYCSLEASTRLGQKIVNGTEGYFGHIKSDSEKRPTQGVSLLNMSYINTNGYAMQMFLYKVSLGNISVAVSLPEDKAQLGKLATLTDQAAAIEGKSVYTVWGGINGGPFASDGQPAGILHYRGDALKSTVNSDSKSFFAILKDGQAVCMANEDYSSVKDRIAEAVGGGIMLLENGYILNLANNDNSARAAVGVSQDGGEVYLLTVDGADFYYSNGISYNDLAAVMKSCGAYNAIALAANEKVTAFWRNERLSTLFEVINKPKEPLSGVEGEIAIANGLVIVER